MKNVFVFAGLAAAALTVLGWPTQKEIDAASPVINELMAPKMSGKPQEVAEAALGLAAQADTEAEKFLLLRMAVELYAKAGDDEQTSSAFEQLVGSVGDVPLGVQTKMLLDAGKALSKIARPERTEALYQWVNTLVSVKRELVKAQQEIEKSPANAGAHLRAGNALTILGDWPKALEHLSVSNGAVAPLADRERKGTESAGKLADGWWRAADPIRNTHIKNAYRTHAAKLYRKAVADGELTGLNKNLAESRIAELENSAVPAAKPAGGGKNAELYCVVDLSPGPDAESYPVTYMKKPPDGGFNADEYKTTKLVLRRIDPGTFKMCGKYKVTLSKPYYIGIFEVTLPQYYLVTGIGDKSNRNTFPAHPKSYDTIRGPSSEKEYNWPNSSKVAPNTFMGRIRARTGLDFDLPTEAQWEFACRAGTKSDYNNGGSSESDLKKLGRYKGNQSDGKGEGKTVAPVGSYLPNAWGLYDMHGNVCEWCLDYWGRDIPNNVKDPVGPSSRQKNGDDDKEEHRIRRGGAFLSPAGVCSSGCRDFSLWWGNSDWACDEYGFRLVVRLP